jgi:predicted lipoprotein
MVSQCAATVGLAAVVLASAGCATAPGFWHYQSDRQIQQGTARSFNATSYAASMWSSKVVPTAAAKAVPAAALLPLLASDQSSADRKYGHQAATGGSYSFLVKGTGTVTAVDTTNQIGPVTVAVDGAKEGIQLATGPVFVGTALRDAFSFIHFGDFTNQIQYADVATALNAQVRAKVIGNLDRAGLKGKKVSFVGAFTPLPGTAPLVVPTELKVGP